MSDIAFEYLRVGDVVRFDFQRNDRSRNGPFHVRGRVDDKLIVRWYGQVKQWWHYVVWDDGFWSVFRDHATITRR